MDISLVGNTMQLYHGLKIFYFSIETLGFDIEPFLLEDGQILQPEELLDFTNGISKCLLMCDNSTDYAKYVKSVNDTLRKWALNKFELKVVGG